MKRSIVTWRKGTARRIQQSHTTNFSASFRSYGVQNPEWEKDSMEDLVIEEKHGLDMARKSRSDLTDDEVDATEERLERLGIVEGEDLRDEEIMGVE
jgi:hypothetical protein